MRLTRLQVSNFRCIEHVDVDLDHDWVVIHGPNDIGKSTLASAIRMALLGRIGSTIWDDYQPWGTTANPKLILDFRLPDEDATYRVTKRKTTALLQRRASGGSQFHDERRDRGVNEYLFKNVLRWGLAAPSKYQGIANSFIAELLFAEQDKVSWILSGDAAGVQKDKSETAREWLTEALEAKALDPDFREMLEDVAARCDVFFTNTGRYRRGADSPIRKLQEEIETVRTRKKKLEEQWESMSGVREEHTAKVRQLEELTEEISKLESRLDAAVEDEKLRKAHEEARSAWERADARARTIQELETKITEKQSELEELDDQLGETRQLEETAREQHQAAKQAVRSLETGDTDVEKERHRAELKEQLGVTRTKLRDLEHELEAAKATLQRWQKVQTATEALAERQRTAEELQESLEAKRLTLKRSKNDLRRRKAWEVRARLNEASEELQSLEDRARDVATRKTEVDEQLSELNRQLEKLPGAEKLDELVALERDLNLARGKLTVGLDLEVELEAPRTVTATVDDETRPTTTEASFKWHADRTAALVIDGVGRFVVRAGDEEQHRELEALQQRWRDIGVPVLSQTTSDSAEALANERADLMSRKAELESELRDLTADAPDAEQLEDAKAAVSSLREQRDALGDVDDIDGAASLPTAAELEDRVESLRDGVQQLETKQEVNANRVADAQKDATERREEAGPDIERRSGEAQELIDRAAERKESLEKRASSLEDQLRDLDGAQATQLEEARELVERREQELEKAKRRREQLESERQELSDAIATLRGELKKTREGFDPNDVARLRDKLEATPRPSRNEPTDPDELEAELRIATREKGELETKAATLAGHIQNATGPAAKDELEELTARLERLEAEEHQLLTDAEGWKLLDEVMKDVESTEAGNLGASVIPLVEPRIHEIAGPAYSLDVDPTLAGSGAVKTPGGLQELEKISVGTREQIATLFRLALAEKLRSTVVLDDQLVQSDLKRMDKLLAILREVSERAQILVFTCRPGEYRVEGAQMIDLQRELSLASAS